MLENAGTLPVGTDFVVELVKGSLLAPIAVPAVSGALLRPTCAGIGQQGGSTLNADPAFLAVSGSKRLNATDNEPYRFPITLPRRCGKGLLSSIL